MKASSQKTKTRKPAKAKPVRKKPEGQQNKPLDRAVAKREEMFAFWHGHGRNYSQTATEYKIDRKTAYRYAKADKWEERADKVDVDIAKQTDNAIVRANVNTYKVIMACFAKEATAYLKKDHVAAGDIRALVAMAQYLDDRGAGMPAEETTNEAAAQIAEVIKSLGADGAKSLAELALQKLRTNDKQSGRVGAA